MTQAPNADEHLAALLSMISQALRTISDDNSPPAVQCEAQATAAHDALLTVCGDDAVGGASHVAGRRRQASTPEPGNNPAPLLAAAERRIARLPSQYRNQLAACAASSYRRRARQALAG